MDEHQLSDSSTLNHENGQSNITKYDETRDKEDKVDSPVHQIERLYK